MNGVIDSTVLAFIINLHQSQSFYVSGGMRWRELTPYLTYAQTKPIGPDVLGVTGFDQKLLATGMRWTVSKNAAAKIQFDHVKTGSGNKGYFVNFQPGFRGDTVNVVSASLDFVF